MRLSVLTSLALAGTAFAAPAQQINNVQFVLDGYKIIISNAKQLVTKVDALKAGDDIVAKLQEMSALSGKTIAITETLTTQINATPGKLTAAAAGKLATPSQEVSAATTKIIDTLVVKKQLFVTAKVHTLVLEDLNHLNKVAIAFVAAAKAKIPDQYVAIANPPFQQLLDALAQGIKNFA